LKDKTVSTLKHYEDLFSACGVSLVRPESTRFEISKSISPAYRQCVRLARTILERQGVELSGDGEDVTLPSIVIDMEILFEQYVRRVIQKQLKPLAVHDGNKEGARPLFDNRSNPPANPDVVIEENSACVMIGEVKYKLAESRDDINQVLAYAVTYRSNKIILFLPADNRERSGLYEVGRVNDINVYRYRIDLASSDLDNEEREMGSALKTLIAT
jgi:5-methylcytosine-specific restriction enzyme subunit McrC